MNLPAPLAVALRALADWLDDRLTIAAIGLATGYFGLGDAQWDAISNWIVDTATVVLVLVPDPRKKRKNADPPPIELVGKPLGHNDASENMDEAPDDQPGRAGPDVAPQGPVLRRPGAGAERDHSVVGLRRPVPSGPGPGEKSAPERAGGGGWNG